MIKLYFLVVVLLLPTTVLGQFKSENSNLYFEKVYEVDLDKTEIKKKVHEWTAINFNNSNNVIKLNTEDKLISKGVFDISYILNNMPFTNDISFSMITEFKDGRYKVLINNLQTQSVIGSQTVSSEISSEKLSFEDYKEMYRNSVDAMTGKAKKYAQKQLKDEEYLKKMYAIGVQAQDNITKKTKERVTAITKELEAYIKSGDETEEW